MLHQKQPNSWSCMAAAAATVLDMTVTDFYRVLGHDGGEIMADGVRRGVHVQEVIDVAWEWGRWVTRVDYRPQSDGNPPWPVKFPRGEYERFKGYVKQTQGILLCRTASGRGHAMANSLGYLYDPAPGADDFLFEEISRYNLYPFSLLIVGQRNELQRSG